MVRDVKVTVNRLMQAVSQKGFGLPLILATNAVVPYSEYTDISQVAVDYNATTNAYEEASALFAQGIDKIAMFGILYTDGVTPVADLTNALNNLRITKDDWYFLICDVSSNIVITELSNNFVGSAGKLYFSNTNDLTLPATLTSDRTIIVVKDDITDNPASGWVGEGAKHIPGTITWKFKTLSGIISDNTITEAQITQLHADGGNTYIKSLGVNYTSEGQTTSNDFIDIIRTADYIEARLTEDIFQLLTSSLKIPYTQDGINQIASTVMKRIQIFLALDIVAKDDGGNGIYNMSIPNINDIPANDKANRILTGISVNLVLAGAIHSTNVTINLVLEL